MPESAGQAGITGDEIVNELIRNAESGAFPIRYTTLVPCIYNVYLHPEDYQQIRPIAAFLRNEAKQALQEHLDSRNRTGLPSGIARVVGLAGGRQPEYRILEKDWTIEFHPDVEDRLARGDIEVYSELGRGEQEDLGDGAKTTFITRRAAGEETASRVAGAATAGGAQLGHIRYSDESGAHDFAIRQPQVVIGRGGKGVWVDLRIEGPPDVSREHCRIRHDGSTWFIKDLSQFGTTVNGQALPCSLERKPSGERVDRNVEVELPARAQIVLAGVIALDFDGSGA